MDQIVRNLFTPSNRPQVFHLPQELQDIDFKQIREILNPMAIKVQRIFLIHEKLHFLRYSVLEVLYELVDVFGPFQ